MFRSKDVLMNNSDFEKAVCAVIPDAAFEVDNYGQIIIYTGLSRKRGTNFDIVVPFEEPSEGHED